MDISNALARIAEIEMGITAEDTAGAVAVKRVYDQVPNASQKLTDLPCWINTWTFTSDQRGPFGVGTLLYPVTATLFMGEAAGETARIVRQGRLMHTAFVEALRADIRLGDSVSWHDLRGGEPTEGIAPWAGVDYLAYVHILDLHLWESAAFG